MTETEKGITVVGFSPTMRVALQSDIYKQLMTLSIGGKDIVLEGTTEKELNDLLESCSDRELTDLSEMDFSYIERRISPNCKDFSKAKSLKNGRNKADRKRDRANRWR